MKHHGSILEFTEQRNKALMRAYKDAIQQAISQHRQIKLPDIARQIVSTPCQRFWVSEERAAVVISAIMQGKPLPQTMRPTKREMFLEIHRRVIQLQQQRPDDSLPTLVTAAVNSPAPCFYMQPRCAMEIIYKIKNGFYNKK